MGDFESQFLYFWKKIRTRIKFSDGQNVVPFHCQSAIARYAPQLLYSLQIKLDRQYDVVGLAQEQ